MNIAVACSGLEVAKRLDSAECFTCYAAPKGVMSGCRTFPNPKKPIRELAELFQALGIDVFICGSLLDREQECLEAYGIEVVTGAGLPASEAAHAFLAAHMTCDFGDED